MSTRLRSTVPHILSSMRPLTLLLTSELAQFHANSANAATRSFATYLLSGELFPTDGAKRQPAIQTEDVMDVDMDATRDGGEDDEVPVTTLTLVGEDALDRTYLFLFVLSPPLPQAGAVDAKSRYKRIFTTHVYCLSPSPVTVRAPSYASPLTTS